MHRVRAMKRRDAIVRLAALGWFAFVPSARSQPPAKLPRVVTLTFGSPYNARSRAEAFRKGMRELGYEEGTNVRYEWRSANGQADLLREMALALSREKVDVIVSSSSTTTEALVQATKTIPIVMATCEDPVVSGFVRSLAHPEANVTGFSDNALDQLPRHMELLAKAVPSLTRAAALMNPSNSIYAAYRSRLEAAAKALRVQLVVVDAANSRDIDRAFSELEAQRIDALVVMSDGFFYTDRTTITELANRFRVPAIYPHQGYTEAGGLMSYGPNIDYNYFHAATFVDKILRGARPADLPIEQPANQELIVNRGAARSIGLALPADLVKRARKVIG
jgi:putative ABC transport system substrate-binding protein